MSTCVAVILGCGTVGAQVAHMLAVDGLFDHVVLADRNEARARDLAAAVAGNATSVQADSSDETAIANLLQPASVVLNTTGPFTPRVTTLMRAALQAGVPYADINDEATVLWDLFETGELDAMARQCGVPLVVGLGTSPGLTNIWARYLADQLDTVTALHIAIAMDPHYRNPTVFRHRFSVHGGPVVVFRQGRWKRVAGFGDEETICFPEPIGAVRVHLVGHCEPVTLPRFLPDLQTVQVKAGFMADTVNRLLHDVIRYGLTSTEPIVVDTTSITPAAFTAAFLSSPAAEHLFREAPPAPYTARQVQVHGRKDGKPCTLTLQVVMATGAASTAMPLAVTARLLVQGRVPQAGLLSPEVLEPRPFLEQLERQGVRLHLRREEVTDRFSQA